jgi:type I pantothenate kinase
MGAFPRRYAADADGDEVKRLRSLNDPIDLDEVRRIYLSLSRLLSAHVESSQMLFEQRNRFLSLSNVAKTPFVIGIAGSVAVGKSTTARILKELLRRWPSSPKVDLVTTDGFLYPNAVLQRENLMQRKGFPGKLRYGAILRFLSAIKAGQPNVKAPSYSHLVYDVLPDEYTIVDRPDILIFEGINVLQSRDLPAGGKIVPMVSDFFDFSIYIDADESQIHNWYVTRFMRLRETAFRDPNSFFIAMRRSAKRKRFRSPKGCGQNINLKNLRQNILPTRPRADLILRKGQNHLTEQVALRKESSKALNRQLSQPEGPGIDAAERQVDAAAVFQQRRGCRINTVDAVETQRPSPPRTTTSPLDSLNDSVRSLRLTPPTRKRQLLPSEMETTGAFPDPVRPCPDAGPCVARRIEIDEAGLRRLWITGDLVPDIQQFLRHIRPGPARRRVDRLVAIAALLVRDPAERSAIGHAHRHRLAGSGHDGHEERRVGDDRADRSDQGLLTRAVEIFGAVANAVGQLRHLTLLNRRRTAAHLLDFGTAGLFLQPPLDRTLGRLGLLAWRRRRLRRPRGSVPSAVRAHPRGCAPGCGNRLRLDHQHAILRQAPAGELDGIGLDPIVEGRRVRDVEEQLDCGRDLVDVLPAGTARQNELFRQFPSGDGDAVVDIERVAGHAIVLSHIGGGLKTLHGKPGEPMPGFHVNHQCLCCTYSAAIRKPGPHRARRHRRDLRTWRSWR